MLHTCFTLPAKCCVCLAWFIERLLCRLPPEDLRTTPPSLSLCCTTLFNTVWCSICNNLFNKTNKFAFEEKEFSRTATYQAWRVSCALLWKFPTRLSLVSFASYPSIFLAIKSGRGRDLVFPPNMSRKIEGPLLAGYLPQSYCPVW